MVERGQRVANWVSRVNIWRRRQRKVRERRVTGWLEEDGSNVTKELTESLETGEGESAKE